MPLQLCRHRPYNPIAATKKNDQALKEARMAPQVQFGFCADLNWKYLLGRSRHSQSVARQRPTRSARECENSCWKTTRASRTYTAQQINPLFRAPAKRNRKRAHRSFGRHWKRQRKMADSGKRQALLSVLSQVGTNNEPVEREFHPQVDTVLCRDRGIQLLSTNPSRLRLQRSGAQSDQSARSNRRLGGGCGECFFAKIPPKQNLSAIEKTPSGASLFVSAPIKVDDKKLFGMP